MLLHILNRILLLPALATILVVSRSQAQVTVDTSWVVMETGPKNNQHQTFMFNFRDTEYPFPIQLKDEVIRRFHDKNSAFQKKRQECYGERKGVAATEQSETFADCHKSQILAHSDRARTMLNLAGEKIPLTLRDVISEKCEDIKVYNTYQKCLYDEFEKIRQQFEQHFSGSGPIDQLFLSKSLESKLPELVLFKSALLEYCNTGGKSPTSTCADKFLSNLTAAAGLMLDSYIETTTAMMLTRSCQDFDLYCVSTTPKDCSYPSPGCSCKKTRHLCDYDQLLQSVGNFNFSDDPAVIFYSQNNNDGTYAQEADFGDNTNVEGESGDAGKKDAESKLEKRLARAKDTAVARFGNPRLNSCSCRYDKAYFDQNVKKCEKRYKYEEAKVAKYKGNPKNLLISCLNYDPATDSERQLELARAEEMRKGKEEVKTGVHSAPPPLPQGKKGVDLDTIFNAHTSEFFIGGGVMPECDEFIPREFCGGAGRYDYRYYQHETIDEDDNLVDLINKSTIYKRTEIIDPGLGDMGVGAHMEGAFSAVKPYLKNDLVNFMGDMFIEKYLQMSYLNFPESEFETKKNELEKIVKEAGCYTNNDNESGELRVNRTKNEMIDLLNFLGTESETKANKEKYRNNMALAAQCAHAATNRFQELQMKLGLDVQIYNTIIDNQAVENMDVVSRTVVNTVTSLPIIRHFLREMPLITGLSEYASRPCSFFQTRHGDPLDCNGDTCIDRNVEGRVPKNLGEGKGWIHCNEKGGDCKEYKYAVSREIYCDQVAYEFRMMSEEISLLYTAYPLLAEKYGPQKATAAEHIARSGNGIDPRVKDYQLTYKTDPETGQQYHEPCMGRFMLPPPNPNGLLEEADPIKKDEVNHVISSQTQTSLDSITTEIKKLCTATNEKLEQVIKDPKFMGMYFNCDRKKFGLLATTFHNPSRLQFNEDISEMDSIDLRNAEINHTEKIKNFNLTLGEKTQAVSQKQCVDKIDSGWAVCQWNKKIKRDEEQKAFLANALQLVFDVATPFMMTGALASPRALLTPKGLLSAGVSSAVGYGVGYGMSKLMSDDPSIKAETNIAAFRAGIKADKKEFDQALEDLERYEKNNPHHAAGMEGAIGGFFGSLALSKRPAALGRAYKAAGELDDVLALERVVGVTDEILEQKAAAVGRLDLVLAEVFPKEMHANILKKPPHIKLKLVNHFIKKAAKDGIELEDVIAGVKKGKKPKPVVPKKKEKASQASPVDNETPELVLVDGFKNEKDFIKAGKARTKAAKLKTGTYLKGNSGGAYLLPDGRESYQTNFNLIVKESPRNFTSATEARKILNNWLKADKNGTGPKVVDWSLIDKGDGKYQVRMVLEDVSDISSRPEYVKVARADRLDAYENLSKELGISEVDANIIKEDIIRETLRMQMAHSDGHRMNMFVRLKKTDQGYVPEVVAIDLDGGIKSDKQMADYFLAGEEKSHSYHIFYDENLKTPQLLQYNFHWNKDVLIQDLGLDPAVYTKKITPENTIMPDSPRARLAGGKNSARGPPSPAPDIQLQAQTGKTTKVGYDKRPEKTTKVGYDSPGAGPPNGPSKAADVTQVGVASAPIVPMEGSQRRLFDRLKLKKLETEENAFKTNTPKADVVEVDMSPRPDDPSLADIKKRVQKHHDNRYLDIYKDQKPDDELALEANVLSDYSDYLRLQGVPHSIVYSVVPTPFGLKKSYYIRIIPMESGGHKLNRVAHQMQLKLEGTQLTFAPKDLVKISGEAFYRQDINIISVSHKNIIDLDTRGDSVMHEVEHRYRDRRILKQKKALPQDAKRFLPEDFYGSAIMIGKDNKFPRAKKNLEAYSSYMSFDELSRSMGDIRRNLTYLSSFISGSSKRAKGEFLDHAGMDRILAETSHRIQIAKSQMDIAQDLYQTAFDALRKDKLEKPAIYYESPPGIMNASIVVKTSTGHEMQVSLPILLSKGVNDPKNLTYLKTQIKLSMEGLKSEKAKLDFLDDALNSYNLLYKKALANKDPNKARELLWEQQAALSSMVELIDRPRFPGHKNYRTVKSEKAAQAALALTHKKNILAGKTRRQEFYAKNMNFENTQIESPAATYESSQFSTKITEGAVQPSDQVTLVGHDGKNQQLKFVGMEKNGDLVRYHFFNDKDQPVSYLHDDLVLLYRSVEKPSTPRSKIDQDFANQELIDAAKPRDGPEIDHPSAPGQKVIGPDASTNAGLAKKKKSQPVQDNPKPAPKNQVDVEAPNQYSEDLLIYDPPLSITFENIDVDYPPTGSTLDRAQSVLPEGIDRNGLRPLKSGGMRDVFAHPDRPDEVIKVFDPSKLGEEVYKQSIIREMAVYIYLREIESRYLQAGLKPPFRVAEILSTPDEIKKGIIRQRRVGNGQTMWDAWDEYLSPQPPPFYSRFMDEVSRHQEPVAKIVEDKTGLVLRVSHKTASEEVVGIDWGSRYNNVAWTTDAQGEGVLTFYDW